MEQKAYNYVASLAAIQLPDYRDSQNRARPLNTSQTEATVEQSMPHVNTFPDNNNSWNDSSGVCFGLHTARVSGCAEVPHRRVASD